MAEPNGVNGKKPHAKGFALGVFSAGPASYLVGSRFTIPTRAFDWIIQNGFDGLCLVAIFVLAAFAFWCLRELLRGERDRRREQENLLREQTDLVKAWQGGKIRTTEMLERIEKLLVRLEGAP